MGDVPKDDSHGSSRNFYNFSMFVSDLINKQLDQGVFKGPYKKSDADAIYEFIGTYLDVKDKHVLVIGSETPWIEIMALRHGAKHVTTLEYSKIISEHPQISGILPLELSQKFLDNSLEKVRVQLFLASSKVEFSYVITNCLFGSAFECKNSNLI